MKQQNQWLFEAPSSLHSRVQEPGVEFQVQSIQNPRSRDSETQPSSSFINTFVSKYRTPKSVIDALRMGLWFVAIQQAIYAGIRDESNLTDMIFNWANHERKFRPINAGTESKLVEEWKAYRDSFVRPLLDPSSTKLDPPDPLCDIDPLVLNCFPAYKVSLQPWHENQLDQISIQIVERFIDENPVSSILVVGHAADFKASDDTFGLGFGRAMSVKAGLEKRLKEHSKEISSLLILPMSLADLDPISTNKTQSGRRLNRRVSLLLIQAPLPPPPPEECIPLSDIELREVVLAILGRQPKTFNVAIEFFKTIKRADTKLCKRIGKGGISARLLCIFLTSYVQGIVAEFNAKPEAQIQAVRGSAYALMDAARGRQRKFNRLSGSPELKQALQQGYNHIYGRLQALREDSLVREQLDNVFTEISCRKNKIKTTTIIYQTILHVVLSESPAMRSQVYIQTKGNCMLDYPLIRNKSCGPLSGEF